MSIVVSAKLIGGSSLGSEGGLVDMAGVSGGMSGGSVRLVGFSGSMIRLISDRFIWKRFWLFFIG